MIYNSSKHRIVDLIENKLSRVFNHVINLYLFRDYMYRNEKKIMVKNISNFLIIIIEN